VCGVCLCRFGVTGLAWYEVAEQVETCDLREVRGRTARYAEVLTCWRAAGLPAGPHQLTSVLVRPDIPWCRDQSRLSSRNKPQLLNQNWSILNGGF
jgi:hypothetical protein